MSVVINGFTVKVHPLLKDVKRPKFQLSPEFAASCSKELRDSTNAWLAEFFGMEEVCYVLPADKKLYISAEHMAMLRNFK